MDTDLPKFGWFRLYVNWEKQVDSSAETGETWVSGLVGFEGTSMHSPETMIFLPIFFEV